MPPTHKSRTTQAVYPVMIGSMSNSYSPLEFADDQSTTGSSRESLNRIVCAGEADVQPHNAMMQQNSYGQGYNQQQPSPDQDRGGGAVAAGAGAGCCCACLAPFLACCACCEILDCLF
jgi:hypothetical protein